MNTTSGFKYPLSQSSLYLNTYYVFKYKLDCDSYIDDGLIIFSNQNKFEIKLIIELLKTAYPNS